MSIYVILALIILILILFAANIKIVPQAHSYVVERLGGQATPVFLPGESQGWQSLVGCCLWGRTVGHD